jgi:hypothetical protein
VHSRWIIRKYVHNTEWTFEGEIISFLFIFLWTINQEFGMNCCWLWGGEEEAWRSEEECGFRGTFKANGKQNMKAANKWNKVLRFWFWI